MSEPDQPDEKYPSAPTRLDDTASGSNTLQTRLDVPHLHTQSAHTVRDDAVFTQGSLIQLPSALRNRYRILNQLRNYGAEADLLLVEPNNNEESGNRVVKLYRRGIQPKEDVLAKVKDGCPDHLVRIYDYGQSDGHWYEVLEYIEHGSLRRLLRDRPMPEAYLREILRELAAGIEHLHSYGIVHRDLKPENILVREQIPLDLVIIDFGISSPLKEMSKLFENASRTVRYAAPEAIGGETSRANDYWSLGIILVEACLGRHPFVDLSDERAVTSWVASRSVDLSGVTDSRWRNLLRGLLQRDPKSRWGAAQINRWLEGDNALVAPIEQELQASKPVVERPPRTSTPYQIDGEECWTAEQLGIALARNWGRARQDLGRGLLRKWFPKELRSVETERLFLDIEESSVDLDDKLLTVILHLCPDIPPSFKGISLATPADIGRLLDGARSASEDSDAKTARSLVDDIVSRKLLERFNISDESPLRKVLERLDAYRRWREDKVSLKHLLTNDWFHRTKLPAHIKNRDAAQSAFALAAAIDTQQADRIWGQARTFADAAAWRFWFHGCLDWVAARNDYFDVLLIWELLPRAQKWYEIEVAEVWVEPLSSQSLATAWRTFLESDYRRACSLVESLKSDISSTDSGEIDREQVAAGLGLSLNINHEITHGTEELAAVLQAASHGNMRPYSNWLLENQRGADAGVREGFKRLLDKDDNPEIRRLVGDYTRKALAGKLPAHSEHVRWSLIGLLALALTELDVHAQVFRSFLEKSEIEFDSVTWLRRVRTELCSAFAAKRDSSAAFDALKGATRSGNHFDTQLRHLTEQIGRYPNKAASILQNIRPLLGQLVEPKRPVLENYLMLYEALSPNPMLDYPKICRGICFAYSFDDRVLAAASEGNTIQLWDVTACLELRTLHGYTDNIVSIAYSSDGQVLVAGSRDEIIKLREETPNSGEWLNADLQFKDKLNSCNEDSSNLDWASTLSLLRSSLLEIMQLSSDVAPRTEIPSEPVTNSASLLQQGRQTPPTDSQISPLAQDLSVIPSGADQQLPRKPRQILPMLIVLTSITAAAIGLGIKQADDMVADQTQKAVGQTRKTKEAFEQRQWQEVEEQTRAEAQARGDEHARALQEAIALAEASAKAEADEKARQPEGSPVEQTRQDKDSSKIISGMAELEQGNQLAARGKYQEAFISYEKSAQQGNPDAQNNLGAMFAKGQGVAKNDSEAVRWYRQAANQGHAKAQSNLGAIYAQGRGVARDDGEAVYWFRKAAEQGFANAQYNLGSMYSQGRGVSQDDGEAVHWFRKAAEQGNPPAQYFLGSKYSQGRGVSRDDDEAFRWCRKAAELGYVDAQFVLGRLYAQGIGIKKDDYQADHWFRKAAAQGHAEARKLLGANTNHDQSQQNKTPTQSKQILSSPIDASERQPTEMAVGRDPRLRCASKENIISRSLCESRACEKPEYRNHPYCDLFRQQERQQ